MPKPPFKRISATGELAHDEWLSLLPTLTVPPRLQQLFGAVIQDEVVTGPHLAAMALEAGTDRAAIAFVKTLHRHPLVRIGERVMSIYPEAHAHPEAVRAAIPRLACEARKQLAIHALAPAWLDPTTVNALIAAQSRGVTVQIELILTAERPANRDVIHQLKAAQIKIKTRRQGPGPETWRTRLTTVAVDGHCRTSY